MLNVLLIMIGVAIVSLAIYMTNKGDVSISGPVDACYYDAPKKLTLAVGSPARLLWHINAVGAAPPSG